jgi:hypothetical protein
MAIGTDFAVSVGGAITHVANTTVYTILELHAWLQDLADNAAPGGDDNISILSDSPSKMDGPRDALVATRLNLLGAINIDDDAAEYLKFGSIKQAAAAVMYSGLKTIGSIVAASPVYVVQDLLKLDKFWGDGHIQILVKAKTGGVLIDYGLVRAFSRKYGQTYSDFQADLSAGGESAAALATALTGWTTLSEGQCAAKVGDIALVFGDSSHDLGNGNGSKPYKGTITLSNGITPVEAAQVLQYMCREATTSTFDSVEGWRYRALNPAYTPNAEAPLGAVIGGKWYVAQGWWLAGVPAGYEQSYQLIDHNGDAQVPPNIVHLTIGGLLSGDRVQAGRDDGAGGFLDDEYHLNTGNNQNNETIVIKEAIKADTPQEGFIRIGNDLYEYASWSGSTFAGVTPPLTQSYAENAHSWVPFLDLETALTEEYNSFIFSTGFTGRVKVRQGAGGLPIIPFETTFAVGTSGGGTNAIRNSDV